jgi:type IV pilus assembly protein PilN
MIRINLLPQKREGKRAAAAEGGQAWLGVILGVLVLEVILLLFVYNAKRDQLATVNKKNQELQGQIDEIKRQIANHPEIKAQLKEFRDREEAIQKLQSARSGPTSTLLELSRMLTAGRGPTVDRDKIEQLKRDNPTSVPNPNWDPRRLWMTSYQELDRVVRIAGLARDGEDVSEFLRRLSLSDFFFEVRLLPAQKVQDGQTHLELVRFEISAKVRY